MALSIGRDIALIILLSEAFVLALLPLVALYFANRGTRWLHTRVRPPLLVAQTYTRRAAELAERFSRWLVTPMIVVYSEEARLRGLVRGLRIKNADFRTSTD